MMNLRPLTIAILLWFSPSLGLAKHYQLFVLTGQSNSLGVTNGGESDPTIGTDPADSEILFYWDNVANATTSLGDSGGEFKSLQETQGGFYNGSATHWGPEIECARSLYRAGARDFGIIKASRGGGGNTNWSKSAGGHMYEHVTETVAAAVASLTSAGHTFEIVGLLYLQGESDSAGEAALAGQRLQELLANLRGDLPAAAGMKAIVGGIAAAGGNRDTVRANQAALASADGDFEYFENIDQQPRLHDSLHFNKAAKITVGQRFAVAIMDTGLLFPSYGKLVFIGDSITQGGAGFPSYRYQVFRHLVARSASFTFVGSVSGAYQFADLSASTPPYLGKTFSNVHDGHWGWRVSWENGRIPLPASRRSNNRGEGTLRNWTGQASPQQYELGSAGNLVSYPDPAASGSGNTGTSYTPDTACIMIGINDLADGTSAARVRDDIGTLIDQLRASNPEVRIHLCKVLHTDQANAGLQLRVDQLNDLLDSLAGDKNAASSSSPVWVADPSSGFDPASLTHDAVHPNTAGETYIGERIAASLGLVEMPEPASASASPPPIIEKAGASFPKCFDGDQIFDGASFINGWTEVTPAATTESLVGDLSDLRRQHINGAGSWLEGTGSGWTGGHGGSWTIELRLRIDAAPNGVALWLGTGSDLIFVHLFDDRTTNNSSSFTANHDNRDGEFHDFRVAHDAGNARYHVWRDGERLTPPAGVAYDSGSNDNRLILGDSTRGSLGDLYDLVIESIKYDQTGAYLPPGADADQDGMPDSWEYLYFGDVVAAAPDGDEDGDGRSNLDEFTADTDPTNHSSILELERIDRGSGGEMMIYVPDSSPQRLYTLLESTDLGGADPWEAAGPTIIGNDSTLVFPHSGGGVRRFYRVQARIP